MMSGFDVAKNHYNNSSKIPKNKKGKKSQAYIDFLQDVKEFDEGNFTPSKRGLIAVKLGGL